MRGLVIGAGVGGLFTSRALAEKGVDVKLFETNRDVFTHFTGELTGKQAIDLVGTDAVDNRLTLSKVISLDTGKEITIPVDLFLLSADRLKLSLQEMCESAGVKIHFGSRVRNVRIREGGQGYDDMKRAMGRIDGTTRGIPVVKGSKGGSGEHGVALSVSGVKHLGDLVVGCDGVNSLVARELFPDENYRTLKAIRYKIRGRHDFDVDTAHFFFGRDAGVGYIWCYPRSERDLNIGAGSVESMHLMRLMTAFIERQRGWREWKIIARGGDSLPYTGLRSQFARKEAALVGNAAGQVSSLLGGGVESTLQGANCLVKAVDLEQGFSPDDYRDSYISAYPRVVRSAKIVSPILKIHRSGRMFDHMERIMDLIGPDEVLDVVGEGKLRRSMGRFLLRHPLLSLGIFKSYLKGTRSKVQ